MRMVIRGGQSFAPYPLGADAQPVDPLLRDDRDDVGHALPAGYAALLHQDQPQQLGLPHGVLDGGPRTAGQRGYGVDRQDADAGALTLAADDRQDEGNRKSSMCERSVIESTIAVGMPQGGFDICHRLDDLRGHAGAPLDPGGM